MSHRENFEFKAEVKELLHLVINSLYSNKDIFLRELISNSSDAIDKAKYLAITNPEVGIGSTNWKIKISADAEGKKLVISDNGIGMDRDDIINNLGTIAKSGTKEFLTLIKQAQKTQDINLIGQFGVGFYSAFMVADKIEVLSRKVGNDKGVKWSSAADGNYFIEEIHKDTYGTDVVLFIKKGEEAYLDEWKIRNIVKKYSDYIAYPICMDIKRDKELKEETLNSMQAIWLRDKSEIKDEDYNEFYKHISHDFGEPLEKIHYRAEGALEFTALIYIPSKRPFDIYYKEYKIGPQLYVNKVQIMENCEELIPLYLRFVKGIVDSSDLPLNVSREILQNNRTVTQINKNITKKVLEAISGMKKNAPEKYEKFFGEFGSVLKEGIHIDPERKEEIAKLLVFNSTKSLDKKIDFETYVQKMKPEQKEIYYLVGSSIQELQKSPHLEYFRENEIDVILLTGEIDGIIMGSLGEFDGKKLKSVAKGDFELDEKSKKEIENKQKDYKALVERAKEILGDKVKDVKPSVRLKDSVACIVADENEMDETMKRILESMGQTAPETKKILEINLEHDLMKKIKQLFDVDPKSSNLNDYINLIYDLALVAEGEKPKDPAEFSKKISDLMLKGI